MKEKIQDLRNAAIAELKNISNLSSLEEYRVKYLGKKGELTKILRGMGGLSKEERPIVGKLVNEVREELETRIETMKTELNNKAKNKKLKEEKIDVTLPGNKVNFGHRHPLMKVLEELEDVFLKMGFEIVEGPEVETVYNNFDALNSPDNHPSRDKSDTFYITEDILLRTHTSPVQIRTMKEKNPPFKIVSAGRTFRFDDVDDTHSPMFHQLEGLVIDKNITMANLKHTIDMFIKELFGEEMKTRFRPHYFPFTEPSAEVDVSCLSCKGEGCPDCHGTGWSMELLGCGMVHPEVLKNCGLDPDEYSGFAFGLGVDRIAMVKYGINNIRLLFENDMRFLNQF
ncbi:phenylalanine--tRNA ligase subunit alpha [Clostridium sp. D2Q-11]|uniref:Phenylalanine--tRNA ligase alpha subunit n=1 Tax=Anaeromonas frigoriresistens TaxID=2683708 RepID=A0A942UW48_9FIRM|nr:phenylalanine--tRNA ligase subunit alpha [Anaeromonas frigoriresistens]MBS4537986.1 phenylalanine--tRNA ligase subunit alpha [Anaeromonas frigoriresistens]